MPFFNGNIRSALSAPPDIKEQILISDAYTFNNKSHFLHQYTQETYCFLETEWTTTYRETKDEEAFSSTLLTKNLYQKIRVQTKVHANSRFNDPNAFMDPCNHDTFGCVGVVNPNVPYPSNLNCVVLDCVE